MEWIVAAVFFAILFGVITLVVGIAKPVYDNGETLYDANRNVVRDGKEVVSWQIVGFLLLVLWVVCALFTGAVQSLHVIDVKEVAVIKRFGKVVGQSNCTQFTDGTPKCGGLLITWPWESIVTWNVWNNFVYTDENCTNGQQRCLNAATKDTQTVWIRPKLTIKISPDNVQVLTAVLGDDYQNTLVRPRMNSVTKNITPKYEAIELLDKRSTIENEIRAALNAEFNQYSIDVVYMTFENVDFSDEFNAAIEAKVTQTQKAEEEKNKIAVIMAQAQQAEEAARGRARALAAEAQGQAEANAIITASLTPQLIQWQAIQKFNDNVNIALIPSGSGLLLDPSTFLKEATPTSR